MCVWGGGSSSGGRGGGCKRACVEFDVVAVHLMGGERGRGGRVAVVVGGGGWWCDLSRVHELAYHEQ